MESGLQELKFSRYNQKVELSGKLFLYNALTGGYASVDEEYRDNFDKCDFKKLDSMKELAELPNAIINQLMEGGFIIPPFMLSKVRITTSEEFESKFPVGSSAKII